MTDKQKEPSINIDINPDRTPVFYTDNINITMNEDGVVLNFCQKIAAKQFTVVARIGMSQRHAEKFVNKLGSMLVNEKQMKEPAKLKN